MAWYGGHFSMAERIWSKSSAAASSWCPCGYSSPKLLYSLRRSSRVSSVPMLLSVMFSARRSACATPAPRSTLGDTARARRMPGHP